MPQGDRRLLAKVSVPDWQAGDLCTIPGSRDDYRAHIILKETGDFARGVRDVVKPFTEMVSCLFIGSGLRITTHLPISFADLADDPLQNRRTREDHTSAIVPIRKLSAIRQHHTSAAGRITDE